MELRLPIDGVINEINMDSLSKIYVKKFELIISFDPFTKIDGCNFEQLKIGDKISIHTIRKMAIKTKKYLRCDHMVIDDVQAKWNRILKEDTKYSINHHLEKNGNQIRPEIIEASVHQVKNVTIDSSMSRRDKKIITFYNQGKTTRYIAKKVKLSAMHVSRIIRSYIKDKES